MKTRLALALCCLLAGFAAGWFVFHVRPETPPGDGARKVLYYRDPMNPQATSATMKKAPDGMDYVPVYAEETQGEGKGKIAYYKDPMHPWYTADAPGKAPDCGMDLVPVYEGAGEVHGVRIDPGVIQNIGVKTEVVGRRTMTRTLRTSGVVEIDESKLHAVTTKYTGWVEKLHVNTTGQGVRKAAPLLAIYSPELVVTQQEYLVALRYRNAMNESMLPEARREGSELVESVRRRLEHWDIPKKEIEALGRRGAPRRTLDIASPADGIVMEKMVTAGQQVAPGMVLYTIADLSTVWVSADIYQYELNWIRTGQKADITIAYLPDKPLHGTVAYIYPYLNPETKTAKVRVVLENTPDLALKPGMFANVRIASPLTLDAVAVPEQAIIHSGTRDIAVLALGGGYFDPREVTLGVTADGYVQILAGVHEGEKVVTSAQFLIDSESNLKAAFKAMSTRPTEGPPPPSSGGVTPKEPAAAPAEPMTDGAMNMGGPGKKNTEKATLRYTCVMHPAIVRDSPGQCPLCGMALVPKR